MNARLPLLAAATCGVAALATGRWLLAIAAAAFLASAFFARGGTR